MRYARIPDVAADSLHTLAQIFMEVDAPEVSDRNVHLQWYSYNDFYQQEIERKLGILSGLVPAGFLHSDDSPSIRLTVDASGRATLDEVPNPQATRLFRAVFRKLGGLSRLLGGKPFPIAGRHGKTGNSFHSGASLPMSRRPAGLESDLAGRPAGMQRVHVIDASVLPSIASSTITLSVMANAHRIASEFRHYA